MQQSKKFVCQYNYLGKKWVIHIDAASHADAEERAKRLGTLEVLGELGGSVDASIPCASWMVRLKVWLLNHFLPNVKSDGTATQDLQSVANKETSPPLPSTPCSESSSGGGRHIFCFVMSLAGNTRPVRSYAVGDFFSGYLPIPCVDGADGPLADLMRERHPEIEIVDLVLEYAVTEPFQEGGRQHEH